MTGLGRPVLRRGVRLTYDDVRQTHVVLFPEGVLVPNGTATVVLELCDGESTVPQIAEALRHRFAGVREEDVAGVLERFAQRRVIEWR